MTKNFNTNTGNNDEWLTPLPLVQACGEFDLDPCTPIIRPWDTAKLHYHKLDDGLSKEWVGRVWCNPPYGKETFKWLEKLAAHGNGVALIFARTDTKGFHREIFEKANSLYFLKGRIRFCTVDGKQGDASNAPSVLIAYGEQNNECLKNLALKGFDGKFILL